MEFPIEDISYEEHESIEAQMITIAILEEEILAWLIYTYGSHGKIGSAIDCLIVMPSGERIEKVVRLGFKASNNEAEYEALIYVLKTTKVLVAKHIKLLIDSKLLAS